MIGVKPWVTLPRAKGLKYTVMEEVLFVLCLFLEICLCCWCFSVTYFTFNLNSFARSHSHPLALRSCSRTLLKLDSSYVSARFCSPLFFVMAYFSTHLMQAVKHTHSHYSLTARHGSQARLWPQRRKEIQKISVFTSTHPSMYKVQ